MNELLLVAFLASPLLATSGDTTPAVVPAGVVIPDPSTFAEPRGDSTAGAPYRPLLLGMRLPPSRAGGDSAADQQGRRPRAIAYSEWYGHRLTIHRLTSYTMLPLFAGEYWLGNKLMNDLEVASWVRPAHGTVASALGVLFAVNTATGLWNLWDARHDPSDRTRRTIHAVAMLAADAGMVWTASLAGDDEGGSVPVDARPHRNAALASIGVGTLGTVMMWVWKK